MGGARVQVLGPVRVTGPGGAVVDVPGVNGKALIVSLVLAKGAVVSVPSLIDDIWQDEPPRNARAALQTLVSRVRAVTGDELIESVAGGYRLGTDAVDLWSPDAQRRGEPGADLGETELATRLRETADGLRVRALEARVAEALRSGSPAAAVEAAAALADAAPYDEHAQLLLMKALATDGRRNDALRVFAEFRQRLDEELGTRPGAALVGLNAELLREPVDEGPNGDAAPRSGDGDRPGAGASAPALTHRGDVRHVHIGLRAAPNRLIGRDADVAALERLVAQARLTTILGPGGLGKTRLAQELAGRAARTIDVVVVELAGIREPEDVPLAVAATLGIGEAGSSRVSLRDPIVLLDLRTRIHAALAERPTLLVLDNCEHVIVAAAELVDELLSSLPNVRVLATSRAPLQLTAESVYPLDSLAATDASGTGPAVRLFLERARAARPGAALPLDAVARLCDHLDGLPLAIELAAARIRSMSVDEIERRLSNRFALLRGGDRSAPERHRTLIAVIDWSWNLLSASERRMLRRLSRFPDGFSAEAAAVVAAADPRDETTSLVSTPREASDALRAAGSSLLTPDSDDLDALVTQSLVAVSEGPAGVRYRMLETVREFGDMALVDAGEDELVAAAQARWARAFALDLIAGLQTARQAELVRALSVEHDNLLAVLRACGENGDAEVVVPLFAALLFFWIIRNQFREALAFALPLAQVIETSELPEDAPDAAAIALLFTTVMGVAGSRAPRPGHGGHNDEEIPAGPEAELFAHITPSQMLRRGIRFGLRLRRLVRSGAVSPFLTAVSELLMAGAHGPVPALASLETLLASDDELVRVVASLFSGFLTENTGDIDLAGERARAAWEGSVRLGLDWMAGQAAQNLAQIASQSDRPAEALEWSRRSAERFTALGAIEEINQIEWMSIVNKLKLGEREGAREALERFVNDEKQPGEGGFDAFDMRAIGWAGLA